MRPCARCARPSRRPQIRAGEHSCYFAGVFGVTGECQPSRCYFSFVKGVLCYVVILLSSHDAHTHVHLVPSISITSGQSWPVASQWWTLPHPHGRPLQELLRLQLPQPLLDMLYLWALTLTPMWDWEYRKPALPTRSLLYEKRKREGLH